MKNTSELLSICHQFTFADPIVDIVPLGAGFINDTFVAKTDGEALNYILQRKNKNIFQDVPAMMENIHKVTSHLRTKVQEAGGDALREVLTLVATKQGQFYHVDEAGDFWTVCVFIPGTVTHQVATTYELAYQGGFGIGRFQRQLADFHEPLVDILPGFHNIRYRFEQWDKALAADAAGRVASLSKEIGWIETRRERMLSFWSLVEQGQIPTRVAHNDTKLSNMLFDQCEQVLCVIDLDTVQRSTVLNDYGDAMRSYTNTGQEDDRDLSKVSMDLNIFEAYTRGYLSEAVAFLQETEVAHLAFSAMYITYEQVLRFLMDYIDGDCYYKVADAEHNLRRTHAQHRLLESMEAQYEQMQAIVESACRDYASR